MKSYIRMCLIICGRNVLGFRLIWKSFSEFLDGIHIEKYSEDMNMGYFEGKSIHELLNIK